MLWGPTLKIKKKLEGGWGGRRSASPPMHSLQGMFEGIHSRCRLGGLLLLLCCGGGGGGGAYWGLR